MFAFLPYDDYLGRNCVNTHIVYILIWYLYQLSMYKWMINETQMTANKL